VFQVFYGPVCKGVFSASRDKTIKMWQQGNAQPVREFCGHELVVSAIHLNKGIIHVHLNEFLIGHLVFVIF